MSLSVQVISDVICPWCFIGKRRLEKAIAAHGGPVRGRRLPFQLYPQMPREPSAHRTMYTNHSDGRAFGLRAIRGIELQYPASVRQAAPPARSGGP